MSFGYMHNFGYGFLDGYNPLVNYKWATTVSSDYVTDGVELITNGGFDTDSGWIKTQSNGTAEIVNGEGHIIAIDGASNPTLEQTTCVIGETYYYSITQRVISNSSIYKIGGVNVVLDGDGTFTGSVVATATTTSARGGYSAREFYVDNISVQKVIQKPNTMYLKDSGTTPKYPAELHSGQGVLFGTDKGVLTSGNNLHAPLTTLAITVDIPLDTVAQFIAGSGYSATAFNGGLTLGVDNLKNIIAGVSIGSPDYIVTLGSTAGGDFKGTIVVTMDTTTGEIVGYVDSIEVDRQTYIEIVDVVVADTYKFQLGAGGNLNSLDRSFYSGIMKDVYIFNDTLTPTEITKYSTDPNGFFQDVQDGVIDNCVLNMPLDGTDEYVRDYANYSEGVEEVLFPLSNWTTGNDSGASSITEDGSGNIAFDYVATDSAYLNITQSISGNNALFVMEITIDSINGAIKVQDSNTNALFGVFTTAGTYYAIGYIDQADIVVARNDSASDANAVISNISVKQLSGIHEIANYTTSARDTTSTLNYGSQELNFTRDGLWRGDLSSYLECNGSGYADTGWIPPSDSDWTIELTQEFIANGSFNLNGTAGATGRVYIGEDGSGQATCKVGDKTKYISFGAGLAKMLLVWTSSSSSFELYLNGISGGIVSLVNFSTGANTFSIGKEQGNGFNIETHIQKFKVHTDTTKALEDYLAQF